MKKVILICILIIPALCFSQDTTSAVVKTKGDSIAEYAQTFLGTPYKYGSCSPSGFDCSGLTYFVFAHFHVFVPRSAKDYMNFGKEIPIDSCRKGDIIVFRGTHKGDKRAGHVGIIISDPGQPVQFIHASSSTKHSGVVITDYYHSYYPTRFIKVIRVVN
ncbi:MAG: C40 family peptidase [Bacteroidetes bacterium]|nr:C40 family peptidase [Bacteroidota bacterium]